MRLRMHLQVLVDDRRKVEQRALDRLARNVGLVGHTVTEMRNPNR